jgi:uncharacterized protein
MSEDNVEIVRRLYRAMNARDVDAVAKLAHHDMEWIHDRRMGQGPVRGVENVIRYFSDEAEMFSEARIEPEGFRDTDDKVLALLHVTGRGRASDAPFDIRIAHLWTLKEGVVVRGEAVGDRDEALQAAGLSEQAMSEDNVEIVRRSFDAWNRRDLTTMSALWRSDGEIDWSRARGPLKGVYRGRGGRQAF